MDQIIDSISDRTSSLSFFSARIRFDFGRKQETMEQRFDVSESAVACRPEQFYHRRQTTFLRDRGLDLVRLHSVFDETGHTYRADFLGPQDGRSWGFRRPAESQSISPDPLFLFLTRHLLPRGRLKLPVFPIPPLRYNLYPEGLRADRDFLEVQPAEKNDSEQHILIIRQPTRLNGRSAFHGEQIHMDPESKRVERVSFRLQYADRPRPVVRGTFRVLDWKQLKEGQVPARIELTARTRNRPEDLRMEVIVENMKTARKNVETSGPEWTEDPAYPTRSERTTEALREKLRDRPEDSSLRAEYVVRRLIQGPADASPKSGNEKEEEQKPIGTHLDLALDHSPYSALLVRARAMEYFRRNRPEEMRSFLDEQGGREAPPLVLYLGARVEQENPEQAMNLYKHLEDHPAFRTAARERMAEMAIQGSRTHRTFPDVLENYVRNLDVRTNYARFDAIQPPPDPEGNYPPGLLSKKNENLLRNAASEVSSPGVRLLLARALARQNNHDRAGKLYEDLPPTQEITRETGRFLRGIDERPRSLLEPVARRLENPHLLLLAAKKRLQNDRREPSMQPVYLLQSALAGAKKDRKRFLFREEPMEKMLSLIRTVREHESIHVARQMFLQVLREAEEYLLHIDDGRRLAETLFGESPEERYLLVRELVPSATTESFFSLEEAFSEAKSRIVEDGGDQRDYRFLYRLVRVSDRLEESHLRDLAELLEAGIRKEHAPPIRLERLGDLACIREQYRGAFRQYRDALKSTTRQNEAPSFEPDAPRWEMKGPEVGSLLADRNPAEVEEFPAWPLPVKLAFAARRMERVDRGISTLKNLRGRMPEKSPVLSFAVAFYLLEAPGEARSLLETRFRRWIRGAYPDRVSRVLPLSEWLAEEYRNRNAPGKAALVRDMADGLINGPGVEHKQNSLREELDMDARVEEVLEQSYDPLPERTSNRVREWAEQLSSPSRTLRERAKKNLLAVGPRATPHVRSVLETGSGSAQASARHILETFALRHLRKRYLEEENE